jgi:hypothetical protein
MAFTASVTQRDVWGSMAVSMGTFTNSTGDDKGGDINTGLNRCYGLILQPGGSSVASNASVVNETFTANGWLAPQLLLLPTLTLTVTGLLSEISTHRRAIWHFQTLCCTKFLWDKCGL